MNTDTICHFAQEYLDKANAFRDIGDHVKEYANLNTSAAMYLLSLHCSDLHYSRRGNILTIYESLCKRQEDLDPVFDSSPSKKRKKAKIEANEVPLQELFFLDNVNTADELAFDIDIPSEDINVIPETYEIQPETSTPESPKKVKPEPLKAKQESPKKDSKKKASKKSATSDQAIKVKIKKKSRKAKPSKEVKIKPPPKRPLKDRPYNPTLSKKIDHEFLTEDGGFYLFTPEFLQNLTQRFQGTLHPEVLMRPATKRKNVLKMCKFMAEFHQRTTSLRQLDEESDSVIEWFHKGGKECQIIKEWFPNVIKARIRGKALDPYGNFNEINKGSLNENCIKITWKCKTKDCPAQLQVKAVEKDQDGNGVGLFGCLTHHHEISMKNVSEIVFATYDEADQFYNDHIQNPTHLYKIISSQNRKSNPFQIPGQSDYQRHYCRARTTTVDAVPCVSNFSILETLPRFRSKMSPYFRPYSIIGTFFHNHPNEEKWRRSFTYTKLKDIPRPIGEAAKCSNDQIMRKEQVTNLILDHGYV